MPGHEASHGDAVAFEKLYCAHFSRVRDFLKIYLGSASVVDDVAQETLLQFWRQPNAIVPITWIRVRTAVSASTRTRKWARSQAGRPLQP